MNKSLLNSKPGGSKKNPGHNLNSSANKAVIFCQITISDINRPSLKSEVISTKIMRVEKGVIIIKQLKMMWLNGDPLHSTTRDDFLWVDQLFHVVVIMRYLCCQRKYETLDNQQSLYLLELGDDGHMTSTWASLDKSLFFWFKKHSGYSHTVKFTQKLRQIFHWPNKASELWNFKLIFVGWYL